MPWMFGIIPRCTCVHWVIRSGGGRLRWWNSSQCGMGEQLPNLSMHYNLFPITNIGTNASSNWLENQLKVTGWRATSSRRSPIITNRLVDKVRKLWMILRFCGWNIMTSSHNPCVWINDRICDTHFHMHSTCKKPTRTHAIKAGLGMGVT